MDSPTGSARVELAARPHALPDTGWALVLGSIGLVGSAAALAAAPLALDDSYSWVEHTTSEAGGQGVDGAWVARTGFILFGLSVGWIANRCRSLWRQPATGLHQVFAVCMIGVAAYSLRSWTPEAGYDETEDLLHSVAATAMGFAFAFGVAAAAFRRGGREGGFGWAPLDVAAVAASVVLPIGMGIYGSVGGVLQRLMFTIAYLWYGRELYRATGASDDPSNGPPL